MTRTTQDMHDTPGCPAGRRRAASGGGMAERHGAVHFWIRGLRKFVESKGIA
jgi:hypothetical protein